MKRRKEHKKEILEESFEDNYINVRLKVVKLSRNSIVFAEYIHEIFKKKLNKNVEPSHKEIIQMIDRLEKVQKIINLANRTIKNEKNEKKYDFLNESI